MKTMEIEKPPMYLPAGRGRLSVFVWGVLAFVLQMFLAAGPVEAACSPHVGKVVFNEVYRPQGGGTPFVEIKALDPTVTSVANFDKWKIRLYVQGTSSTETLVLSGITDSAVNSCGQASLWYRFPDSVLNNYINTWDPRTNQFNFVLFDSNDNTIVDVMRLGPSPSSIYGPGTNFSSCDTIEASLPSTQYDAIATTSGASQKDWYRVPDGTGAWTGSSTSGTFNTVCGSNEPVAGAPTFGVAKSASTTSVAANSNFDYTLWAINGGTAVSSPASVVITDNLTAAGLTFVSCVASPGTISGVSSGPTGTCTNSGNTVTWTVGAMAANKSYKVTLTVKATTTGTKINTITTNVGTIQASAVPVTVTNPQSFLVTPSSTTASSCATVGGSPAAPYVTITAKSLPGGAGSTVATYTGSINLSTSTGHGTWAIKTGAGVLSGNTYTFAATDNGSVELYLTNPFAESLTVTATDPSLGISGTSVAITFSDNALVLEDGDTKAGTVTPDYTIVAGRPHKVYASVYRRTGVNCGLNPSFNNASVAMKLWLTTTTGVPGTHPAGATLPTVSITTTCPGALSLPTTQPGSTNINLGFSGGQATFYLCTTDVGQYQLNGSSTQTPGSVQSSTTSAFTAVPFAIAVSSVKQGATNNPANTTAAGSVFAKAGTDFEATVGGYLWQQAADGTNWATSDGLPDAGVTSDKVIVSAVPRYAQTVTLSAAAPFTPTAASGGTLGDLAGGGVAITGGSVTATTLDYSEVGSFSLAATPVGNYLGAVNLSSRVLFYASPPSTSQTAVVGRLIPDHFDTTVAPVSGVPMPCPSGLTCPIAYYGAVYSGQAFPLTVTAMNGRLLPTATRNYSGTSGFAKEVTLGAWNGVGSTTAVNVGMLSGTVVAAGAFATTGSASAQPSFAFSNALTAPTDIYLRAVESPGGDGVTSLRTVPASSVEGGVKVISGRMKVDNAFGSERLPLSLPTVVQYYNGTAWLTNTADGVSKLSAAPTVTPSAGLATSATCPTLACDATSTVSGGVLALRLSAPTCATAPCVGYADVTLNVPDWLKFKWDGTNLTGPKAKGSFGIYGQLGNSKKIIYRREVR